MNKTFEKLGFYPADILLPKDQDMTKWQGPVHPAADPAGGQPQGPQRG